MSDIHGQYLFVGERCDLIRWPELYAIEGAKRMVRELEESVAKWMLEGLFKVSKH